MSDQSDKPYVWSVPFTLEDKENIIDSFLQRFLRQEKQNLLQVFPEDTTLETALRLNHSDLCLIVHALESFLEEEEAYDSTPPEQLNRSVAFDLHLGYCDDHACGYSWYLLGKYAPLQAENQPTLSVFYEDSWCEAIIIEVGGKQVKHLPLSVDCSSDEDLL